MCGFVGFIGDFDNDLLESSINAIQHRGPDDKGSFFDPEHSIGFGFSRLAIQDLSQAGHQPMLGFRAHDVCGTLPRARYGGRGPGGNARGASAHFPGVVGL